MSPGERSCPELVLAGRHDYLRAGKQIAVSGMVVMRVREHDRRIFGVDAQQRQRLCGRAWSDEGQACFAASDRQSCALGEKSVSREHSVGTVAPPLSESVRIEVDTSRVQSLNVNGNDGLANKACTRTTSVNGRTVTMPMSLALRMIRRAISPRLATSNVTLPKSSVHDRFSADVPPSVWAFAAFHCHDLLVSDRTGNADAAQGLCGRRRTGERSARTVAADGFDQPSGGVGGQIRLGTTLIEIDREKL
jgi:hypothetical protein